jgi:DNA topoisomerase-3
LSVVVLAEKPSVARDIARVLGASQRAEGYLHGNGYVVTWAIGHLVRLAEPHEMRPEWKRWTAEALPLIPDEWPLLVAEDTRAQFAVVKELLRERDVREIVCATDAGREGELIFRYIYAASGCARPVRRLWISSLTPDAIRKGFAALRPLSDFDPLADAAQGRSRADWLVGMNLSRAATLAHGELFSVGRVQTPTLALLVEREQAIRAFVPEDYLEVVATFGAPPENAGPQESAVGGCGGAKPPTLNDASRRQEVPRGAIPLAPAHPPLASPSASASQHKEVSRDAITVAPARAPLASSSTSQAPSPYPSPRSAGRGEPTYRGTWFRGDKPTAEAKRLPPDGTLAQAIVGRARRGAARVESVESETRRIPPPLLYDLTELQRHANRLFGLSARQTLGVAQALYEKHKLITYPRTDSRHLSRDVAATLPAVVAAIAAPYRAQLAAGTGERPLSRRFVDDAKVRDHHAVIPTAVDPAGLDLSPDERRVHDLVCRRLLMAWHDEHVFAVTTVITRVSDGDVADRYHSSGTAVQQLGWKALDPPSPRAAKAHPGESRDDDGDAAQDLPPGLAPGQARVVTDVETLTKRTRPPRRFTDATLLTAMETAGATLDDRELSEAMKERGLGTPATRAEIIETLLRREYAERQGKTLAATDKGIRLIEAVHPQVKSPALTGEWEAQLERIRRGQGRLDDFMARIEAFVRDLVARTLQQDNAVQPESAVPQESVVGGCGGAKPPTLNDASRRPGGVSPLQPYRRQQRNGATEITEHTERVDASRRAGRLSPQPPERPQQRDVSSAPVPSAHPSPYPSPRSAGRVERLPLSPGHGGEGRGEGAPPADQGSAPAAGSSRSRDLDTLLHDTFRLPSFRPHQEAACRAVADGNDVLLVMPTGAGKSLCYQLPGLARGGTTLVVSPLIALMEDQVAKLQELGLKAERIHSGRPREASRAACYDYLGGRLDFLFIAPERLRVPGFPDMLARRKPTLVAIDEAHCISEWGHDFRPDYRLLGERLPTLRPAPIIALTATATPRVQADIAAQLGLAAPRLLIHGFRRTNIAIEIAVVKLGRERTDAALAVLRAPERRPAIVYAPTRKAADELAAELRAEGQKAAAYHAGMAAPVRERAQAAFLAGDLDVIVATIAFGMGVDKPDVRSVIHTGLPGSLEGYYQEMGRAGRDGKPSRALLLYSWADRRTHEFFFERDYPAPEVLARVFGALPREMRPIAEWQGRTRVAPDEFDVALDKLWIHGGALVEGEQARRGRDGWRATYVRQREHKQAQLDEMLRCAEAHTCRMLYLLRHFGDQEDRTRPCGKCDVCAPQECVVRRWRAPTGREGELLRRVMEALRARDRQGAGQLHRDSGAEGGVDRRAFEHLLGGLARAGLIEVTRETFEKDGRTIAFQRVSLTAEGRRAQAADLERVALGDDAPSGKGGGRRKRAPSGAGAVAARAAAVGAGASRARRARDEGHRTPRQRQAAYDAADAPPELVKLLKAWRLQEARQRGVPAFHILTDRTLLALASERPHDADGLLAVRGIGPRIVERHGPALLKLLAAGR